MTMNNEFICSKCDLCTLNNHHPMIGDGNLDANIMFVSRNPTAFEMKNNVPLFSKDGMLFQQYLDLFNFHRDMIYVTNAVKCRTPGNRHPTELEISNCYTHLDAEIKTVNPKIIVLMGNTAIRTYFKLAHTNIIINTNSIAGKYMIHNKRIILFMIHPSFALNSVMYRTNLFYSFVTLLQLYREIHPAHNINFTL